MAEPAENLLKERETIKVEERTAPRAVVLYEAIRREGLDELKRKSSALAWSGFAAGLSMGFSLVTEGLLTHYLPDTPWRPLISKFGYSVGFLIVILGRQQLFTENTLTPILPLLRRRNLLTLKHVLRLWGVVLASNLAGAALFAWTVGHTSLFEEDVRATFTRIGLEAMHGDLSATFLRAVFAGWLIALMVWLLPSAETARLWVIIILTYIIGIAGLAHIVAGAVETLYVVMAGAATWGGVLWKFMLPTLLGNIVGGIALVAALNHGQVSAGEIDEDLED